VSIDWFTVIAQIINFLILVALLWKFLYKPIVKAMDDREAAIAARVEAAEQQRRDAEAEAETYHGKTAELDAQRTELIAQARADADTRRQELLADARRHVEATASQWLGALNQQQDAFLADLRRRTGEQVCAAGRRLLTDLAGQDLEERMLVSFVDRLEQLADEDVQRLRHAGEEAGRTVDVRSAFEVPPRQRAAIEKTVARQLGGRPELRFDLSPELICGVEMRVGHWKLDWNVDAYLSALQSDIAAAIADEAAGTSAAAPQKES